MFMTELWKLYIYFFILGFIDDIGGCMYYYIRASFERIKRVFIYIAIPI
jgi:hypothetical protein